MQKKYIIVAVLVVILGGVVGSYVLYKRNLGSSTIQITPEGKQVLVENQESTSSQAALLETPKVSFEIKKEAKKRHLFIYWENLPNDTVGLNIFISKSNTNNWSLWQKISIPQDKIDEGNTELNINSDIGTGGYSFYTEALSNQSETLWTSSSTPAVYATSTPPQESQTQTSSSPPGSPPTSQNPENPPINPTTQDQSATTSSSDGTTYYYSPQGSISGSSVEQAASFWVQHLNKTIEIGWQNIPPNATKVIIYRSSNSSGPWSIILEQQNPVTDRPYTIGLVDNTLNNPYYYKMNVLSGSSIVGEYGPLLLEPL